MWEWIKKRVSRYIVEKERRARREEILRKCGCVCFCPKCTAPLNDQAECGDTDLVRYKCECGYKSVWDFDAGPCPVLKKNWTWE